MVTLPASRRRSHGDRDLAGVLVLRLMVICAQAGLHELPDDSRPGWSGLPELPRDDQTAQRGRAQAHVHPYYADSGSLGGRDMKPPQLRSGHEARLKRILLLHYPGSTSSREIRGGSTDPQAVLRRSSGDLGDAQGGAAASAGSVGDAQAG